MIEYAPDLVTLQTNLQRFMVQHAASLPEPTLEHLMASAGHPSPVDRVVQSAEALYAVKSELSAEGREITAQLAQFAAMNGWHGMGERGLQIAQAMQRIGGFKAPTGAKWISAEEDPEPLSQFVEGEAPTPLEAPAPPEQPSGG